MNDQPFTDWQNVKLGDRFGVHVFGVDVGDGGTYIDQVESVRYCGGSPAIHRHLNRWQRFARKLTPPRWRKPLLVREAEPASITINVGDKSPAEKTLAQLEQMKSSFNRLLGD